MSCSIAVGHHLKHIPEYQVPHIFLSVVILCRSCIIQAFGILRISRYTLCRTLCTAAFCALDWIWFPMQTSKSSILPQRWYQLGKGHVLEEELNVFKFYEVMVIGLVVWRINNRLLFPELWWTEEKFPCSINLVRIEFSLILFMDVHHHVNTICICSWPRNAGATRFAK